MQNQILCIPRTKFEGSRESINSERVIGFMAGTHNKAFSPCKVTLALFVYGVFIAEEEAAD